MSSNTQNESCDVDAKCRIKINCSGKIFETTKKTLMGSGYFRRVFGWDKEPDSSIFSGCYMSFCGEEESKEPFFLDEDPRNLRSVLHFLRYPDTYIRPEHRWMMDQYEIEHEFVEEDDADLSNFILKQRTVSALESMNIGQDDTNRILIDIDSNLSDCRNNICEKIDLMNNVLEEINYAKKIRLELESGSSTDSATPILI